MLEKTDRSQRVQYIDIKGARENNLKNVDVKIPKNKITIVTGLSGSGKSSLVFDTLYAEGQRRYIESLSTYARQYITSLKRPEVEKIIGLSPSIAIDQKSVNYNPRSTVGTTTEIFDFLRLLFSKVGVPHCPEHGIPVTAFRREEIEKEILSLKKGTKFYIFAPVVEGKKGEFVKEKEKWLKKGYLKARVDGELIYLEQMKKLAKRKDHSISLVVDQLVLKPGMEARLSEAVSKALSEANGRVLVSVVDGDETVYSVDSACSICGYSFPELETRHFSFNNPKRACETCNGLGSD